MSQFIPQWSANAESSLTVKLAIYAAILLPVIVGYAMMTPKTDVDFKAFYSAAQLVREGRGFELFNPAALCSVEDRYFTTHGLLFISPPVTAALYWPTSFFCVKLGYLLFAVLSMGATVVAVNVLNRSLRLYRDYIWLLPILLILFPVYHCILEGQVAGFVLLAYSLSHFFFEKQKTFISGIALTLGLVKFPLVLPLAFIMLLRRQTRFVAGFIAGSIAAYLTSVIIAGRAFVFSYYKLLAIAKTSPLIGIHIESMPSIRGLVYILTGRDLSIVLIAGISLFLCLGLATAWSRNEIGFSAAIVLTLLSSYHTQSHDLVLLLFPLLVAARHFPAIATNKIVLLFVTFPGIPITLLCYGKMGLMAIPLMLFAIAIVHYLHFQAMSFKRLLSPASEETQA